MTTQLPDFNHFQRIQVLDKKREKITYEWFKEKKTALLKQKCYIYGFENLSALNVYFIEAFIILLFSSKL